MSDWLDGRLSDSIASLDAGVSVNAEDRPHGAGEVGVLKTSAVSGGAFLPEQNKAVVPQERRLVAESVQGDSILVSRMNTPALVGESCYVRDPHPSLFLPDRLWQLKPKDRSATSVRWLSFVLQSAAYRRHIDVHATGTSGSMKNLPKSKLLALPVRYPAPSEQRTIARILDTLDTAIHETEAIIAKLKAVKQGLLHDMLTRGIDANGELRPPQAEAPHLYKQSALGWIPKEWTGETVGSCCEVHNGLRLPISGEIREQMKGVFPYYGPTGVLDFLNEYRVDGTFVLLGEDGDHFLKFAIWPMTQLVSGRFNVNNHAHVLTGRTCRTDWIDIWFRHRDITLFLTRQGAGRFKLNKAALISLPIALPTQKEQTEICKAMSAFDERISSEVQARDKMLAKKSALMDDLLTGRVRVTPLLDPTLA
jgi:type I restriction enzyme S subunit